MIFDCDLRKDKGNNVFNSSPSYTLIRELI